MEHTLEAILAFSAEQAQKAWDSQSAPYLLARLAPDLQKEGVHYKDILGEQRLKEFLGTAQDRVKLVFHPTQKSRIGLIPPGEHYDFEPDSAPSEPKAVSLARRRAGFSGTQRRYIISNFLQLLADLDDEDAAKVQIPTNILTKLIREK